MHRSTTSRVTRSSVEKKDYDPRETAWERVQHYVDMIFQRRNFDRCQFMDSYNAVYAYCQIKYAPPGDTKPIGVIQMSKDLFYRTQERIKKYISRYLMFIAESADLKMLVACGNVWRHLYYSVGVLSHMYSYIFTSCNTKATVTNANDILSFSTMIRDAWKRSFDETMFNKVNSFLSQLLKQCREGEEIDLSCLMAYSQSFYQVENANYLKEYEICDFYIESFEAPLLKNMKEYFVHASVDYLKNHSFLEYVHQVWHWIDGEVRRISSFTHVSTKSKVMELMYLALVTEHVDQFFRELEILLEKRSHEDIKVIFHILSYNEKYALKVQGIFKIYLESFSQTRFNEQFTIDPHPEPTAYVQFLCEFIKATCFMDHQYFDSKKEFREIVAMVTMAYVNSNSFVNENKMSTPEYLAKFFDTFLKNKVKSEDSGTDFEVTMDNVISLFAYIEEKDVFNKFYSQFLAKRLINASLITMDVESWALSKLKNEAGSDFSMKLEKMLNDISISRNLKENFAKKYKIPFDFSVLVLTRSVWPFTIMDPITLPTEAESITQLFFKYFADSHHMKMLIWLHHQAKVEIVTTCFKNIYTIQMSTYQMAVLFLFNRHDSLTVAEICSMTKINKITVRQILAIILKTKLLISDMQEVKDGSELKDDTVITFFREYKSKKLKLNINVPLRHDTECEREATKQEVIKDRSIEIQACIVRIMKTKKCILHSQLIGDVISTLSSRFKPTVPVIKKNIDTLIEREYLKRSQDDSKMYEYIA